MSTAWLDATAQADLVRSGEATALELVEAAIGRIEGLDPALNAVVSNRFEEARKEAAGALPDGPFRGVPILLKDAGCHVAGQPTSHGTSFLREVDHRWPTTSHLSRLFAAAGFVVLGRTNVPELASSLTTESPANGPARNPWDLGRSTGGSSGGSAAAVAAGLVSVAHASDGGGSIRIPASLCGLVGLKPSRGRVSQGPEHGETWAGATIDGVVTRSVRDSAAVLDVISRVMPGDPQPAPPLRRPLADEVGAPVGRLRVGLHDAAGELFGTAPAARDAVARAGQLLAELGCTVGEAVPDGLFDASFHRCFGKVIAADVAHALRGMQEALGRVVDDAELEPRNVRYRSAGERLPATDYLAARAWLGSWARRVSAFWAPAEMGGGGHDLLVTPTVAGPAPELGWFTAAGPGEEGRRIMEYIPCTAQFNVTGQPAISLPLGHSDDGLPIGVQVVAAQGREDVLVRVAAALEELAPWADRRPPASLAAAAPGGSR